MKLAFLIFIIFACFSMVLSQEKQNYKVFFAADKFVLPPDEKSKLIAFISGIDKQKIEKISLTGYCNDIDTDEHNLILSRNRATQVKNELMSLKIDGSLIVSVVGKGELPLIGENANEIAKQRAENRRVEIFVELKKPEPEIKVTEEVIPEVKTKTEQLFSDSAKVGDKIALEDILFMGNSHIFLEESYPALENLLRVLQERTELHIKILGHVCCGIDDGYDNAYGTKNLSFTRAKAVFDYLVQNGIDKNRLSYTGLAGLYPTGRGDKADKRVEIEITDIVK